MPSTLGIVSSHIAPHLCEGVISLALNSTITISYNTSTDTFLLTASDGSVHSVYPYETSETAVQHYGYSNSQSNTGFEQGQVSQLYFYRQTGTSALNLVVMHDSRNNDPDGGTAKFIYSPRLPAGYSWIVQDDPGEPNRSDTLSQWGAWVTSANDGGVLLLPSGSYQFSITSTFTGIERWNWLQPCYFHWYPTK